MYKFFLIFLLGFCCWKKLCFAQEAFSPPLSSNEFDGKLKTENHQEDPSHSKKYYPQEKKGEKKPLHSLTGIVALLSDYRSRGISQTFLQPAVQGELKYVHASGFYFKSWASSVDGTSRFLNNTSLEWDFFLGFTHPLFDTQAAYDTGFLYYYYPGGKAFVSNNTRYNTLEYYIAFKYNNLAIKLSISLDDYFGTNSSNPPMNWDTGKLLHPNGHSYGSTYTEINYETPFYSKWTAMFHLGYQTITNYSQLNYLDWLIGLRREFKWFEFSLSYIQTNAKKAFYKVPNNSFKPQRINLGGPGIVLAVNKSF